MGTDSRSKTGERIRGRFPKGVSGNPGGRPTGIKIFRFLRLIEKAMDGNTEEQAIAAFRAAIGTKKQVLDALQTGGKFTKEIGADAEAGARPVTIIIQTNIDPSKLGGK